jgi:hypothetical protein
MRCLQCGKPLSLLRRLADAEFCTADHRALYQRHQERLVLARLRENERRISGSPGEPAERVAEPAGKRSKRKTEREDDGSRAVPEAGLMADVKPRALAQREPAPSRPQWLPWVLHQTLPRAVVPLVFRNFPAHGEIRQSASLLQVSRNGAVEAHPRFQDVVRTPRLQARSPRSAEVPGAELLPLTRPVAAGAAGEQRGGKVVRLPAPRIVQEPAPRPASQRARLRVLKLEPSSSAAPQPGPVPRPVERIPAPVDALKPLSGRVLNARRMSRGKANPLVQQELRAPAGSVARGTAAEEASACVLKLADLQRTEPGQPVRAGSATAPCLLLPVAARVWRSRIRLPRTLRRRLPAGLRDAAVEPACVSSPIRAQRARAEHAVRVLPFPQEVYLPAAVGAIAVSWALPAADLCGVEAVAKGNRPLLSPVRGGSCEAARPQWALTAELAPPAPALKPRPNLRPVRRESGRLRRRHPPRRNPPGWPKLQKRDLSR